MDGSRFDALARTFSTASSRRRALSSLLVGALGLVGSRGEDGAAHDPSKKCKKKSGKAKKKCLKKAKAHNAQHAAETPPPPPGPSGPTCSDGIQNGSETGVDCGGSCKRCAGQACSNRADCASALCQGTCQQCSAGNPCGTDVNGGCGCQAGTCFTAFGLPVSSCSACPSSWPCTTVVGGGELACYPPCGASETCGRADACNSNTPTCGDGGYCYQPLGGGPTRCGWPAPAPSCGCPSHAWCQASHGGDAFCVTFDPEQGLCTCGEGGPTTFCAVPR